MWRARRAQREGVSRHEFLAGGIATVAVLALGSSCSDGSDGTDSGTGGAASTGGSAPTGGADGGSAAGGAGSGGASGGANAESGPAGSSGVGGSGAGSGAGGNGGSAGNGGSGAGGSGGGGASGNAGSGGSSGGRGGASGAGGNGGVTGDACSDQQYVNVSEPNSNFAHFHGVAIPSADLEAFLSSGMASTQYTMSEADEHIHTLTLTRANAESLRAGTAVSIGSSFDAGHSHSMRLTCV